jgi:DNA repair exonuclease SbcCD nuclease subunit
MNVSQPPLQIAVPNLSRAVRVLHLTDAHVCQPDGDSPHREKCLARRAKWPAEGHEARFEALLNQAQNSDVDLLLLTGDIVDFPAKQSIDWVRYCLEKCGKPWLYVPGNHDWYFPGQAPDAALRRAQYERLAPLFPAGEPSLIYRHELHGLQFLCVDNSTYQINREQLQFARESLQSGLPTVLLIHIPITQSLLREPTIAKWRDAMLMGEHLEESRRAMWGWEKDNPATFEFIELMQHAPNLVAIFCGHVHFSHEETFSESAVQFVGAPGFEGGCRVVDFLLPSSAT